MLGPDLSQGPGAVPDGGDHGLKIDHSPCDATVDMCAQSGQLCRRLLKAPRKQLLAHVIQRRLPQPGSERVQRFSEKPERLHADHSRCECEQRLSLERLAKTVDGEDRGERLAADEKVRNAYARRNLLLWRYMIRAIDMDCRTGETVLLMIRDDFGKNYDGYELMCAHRLPIRACAWLCVQP